MFSGTAVRPFVKSKSHKDPSIASEQSYQLRWNHKVSSQAPLSEYSAKGRIDPLADGALALQLEGDAVGWPGEAAE